MTGAGQLIVPALRPRDDAVVHGLPESFRPAQVDYLPNSLCWHDGGWLASTNSWGDRRLAQARPDGWVEVPAPPGWIRRPMAEGAALSVLHHHQHADDGQVLALRDDGWQRVAGPVEESAVTDWDGRAVAVRDLAGNARALAAGGGLVQVADEPGGRRAITGPGWRIPIPAGATLSHLAPSPDRDAALVVLRIGGAYQGHIFSLRDGRSLSPGSLRQVVLPTSAWLDDTRVVVVAEEWPNLVPLIWDWSRDSLARPWGPGALGAVRSVAAGPAGTCLVALATPLASRGVHPLDDTGPVASAGSSDQVRAVLVERAGQALPCLVYEPLTALRGTAFYFPGGPHEPIWAEYAPLARAMNELGWRVVRVNVRSSGLREAAYRPRGPLRYGRDDVADACAVIEALAEGPVVTMGMSYGGYLASRAGERVAACRGVAVLSGFLHHDDLAGTGHDGVRQFARFAFHNDPPVEPDRLAKRYFVAHGELDTRIRIAAIERHRARIDGGLTLVPLVGEGHAIHTDRAARATYPPLLQWLSEIV